MSTQLVEVVKDFQKPIPIQNELLEVYKKSNFSGANKMIQVLEKGYKHIDKKSIENFLDVAIKKSNGKVYDTLYLGEGYEVNIPQNYKPKTEKKVVASQFLLDSEKFNKERPLYEEITEWGIKNFKLSDYCKLQLIVETKLKDYNRIPPAHIIQSEIKSREDFDELVVLEPETEEIDNSLVNISVPRISAIKDPILCGKINQFPDSYFLIDAWIDDIDLKSLLKDNIQIEL